MLYANHWPFRQVETARPVRRTVLHDRVASRGACFGVVMGWERANWYAPPGIPPTYAYSFGRQNWFPYVAEEHRAVRETVGVFDQSSFAKLLLEGPDAETLLQHLCANDVAVAPGKIVYTAMLNPRGGIEADLTVTRLADERYFIVTSAAVATHDFDWIRRHLEPGTRAVLTDVSSSFATLGVMGPRSRDLLGRLTDADLSNDAFPFGTAQEIYLGYGMARAMRITYVGELGWEIYIPTELAATVYDALVEAGQGVGLRHAGYHALDSLRMEKAYRAWGHDVTSEDTPLDAGLGFAVEFDKPGGFIGREALQRQRERPPGRRLLVFTLDDPEPLLLGDEPVYRDGALVGRITSGAYGHTIGRAVGLGYVSHAAGVDRAFVESGRWDVEVACERFGARASFEAPYDPRSLRVKA